MAQVADVVLVKDNRVLLVQQKKASAKGLWSYPGGRVEDGETVTEAVIREVREELGVELYNPVPFKVYQVTTSIGPLEINTFTGTIGDQVITLKDDELLAHSWFSLEDMQNAVHELRGELVFTQANDVLSKISTEKVDIV